MHWLDLLRSRGLLQDVSDETALRELPAGTPFYVGFDPTAPSLQIGNLVPIVALIHLAQAGFKPIVLFGGATGRIGDPSGRSAERNLLAPEVVREHVARQVAQMKALLARCSVSAEFVNNEDWTAPISMLDFLRDVGKYFTISYMLQKDSVQSRLSGDGISYTEFSYMLLQANDFLHLYRTAGCRMQVGGSDQWGNITAGLELIRRTGNQGACGMTFPLLTDSAGKKFGKSEGETMWLDSTRTSPYRFHQFWLNVPDSDVLRLARTLTLLDAEQLENIETSLQGAPESRQAQKALADAMCSFVHGDAATKLAQRSADVLFGGSLEGLQRADLEVIFRDVPSSTVPQSDLASMSVTDAFVHAGLTSSKGDTRRLIQGGGGYINGERLADGSKNLTAFVEAFHGLIVLRSGKKQYHILRIAE